MSDATAITNLLYRYAELVDAGDLSGAGDLFEHATVDWGGDITVGSGAVTARLSETARLHDDGTPLTAHVVTNPLVEIDESGIAASCRSRFTVFQATGGLALQPIICGRYEDTFERVDGAWRFASRRYVVGLVGDLSEHLPEDLVERLSGS